MWSRTRTGGSLGLLIVLTVSTGCLNPHFHLNADSPIPFLAGGSSSNSAKSSIIRSGVPFAADKSPPTMPDNRSGGEVVSQPSVAQVGYEQPNPGGPTSTMPGPGMNGKVPSGSVQLPPPNAVGPGGVPPVPQILDPHARTMPTARGAVLNLGPDDQPLDRALDMNRRVEQLIVDNRTLIDRVNTLEARAKAREDVILEGFRDVEKAATEVSRSRNEMTIVRQEIIALRERVKRMEQDEIETLKKVIGALEKLLRDQDE